MTTKRLKNKINPDNWLNGKQYTIADCLLPPEAIKTVSWLGVYHNGHFHYHPALLHYTGTEVMLFWIDTDVLGIVTGSDLLCVIDTLSSVRGVA